MFSNSIGETPVFFHYLLIRCTIVMEVLFRYHLLLTEMWKSYREQYEKSKGKCLFVPDTLHLKNVSDAISETKYKEDKKKLSNSLYKQMPATIDTAFAKEVSQYQSEVLYKQKHDAQKGRSSYSYMQEPPDVKHAMEVSKHQSDASYKKDAHEMHRYTDVLNRTDIKFATQSAKIISDVEYKKRKERPKQGDSCSWQA